jgi:hypothetical protein
MREREKNMQTEELETQTLEPMTNDYPTQLAAAWEVWTDSLNEVLTACGQSRWQGERSRAAIQRHSLEVQALQVFEAYGRARVQLFVQLVSGDLLEPELAEGYEKHWREMWGDELANTVASQWNAKFEPLLRRHRRTRASVAARAVELDAADAAGGPRITGPSLDESEPIAPHEIPPEHAAGTAPLTEEIARVGEYFTRAGSGG